MSLGPRHTADVALAVVVALAALGAAGPLASTARADGDPASDYLIANPVFLAAQNGSPVAAQRRLIATVVGGQRRRLQRSAWPRSRSPMTSGR